MDEVEQTRHWLDAPPTVGAVLVVHNGAAWLPKVLASYATMYHAPTAWHVVDVSSTDGSGELVREHFASGQITYAPSGTGFGDAVRLGVAALPRTDWLWLLHDDAAVLPGTLAGLLDEATTADDIAVVGPKIREWPSLKRLLEVGLTITNTGTRETGLETGEPDAGQHDRPQDVLAVDSAGMLVRRDVWDELGGLDPLLPLHFDDVDFGWRVARAGYRTRTAPGGVLFHAEASRRGTRPRTAGDLPVWEGRRAALYTLLVNSSRQRFAWQYVRLFVGTLLRTLGHLVGKDPESAGDELLALRAVYGHPLDLRAGRRARARTARTSFAQLRGLFPPFWLPYRHGYDTTRDAITAMVRPESAPTIGRRSSLGDGTPDDLVGLDEGPSLLLRRPWLTTVVVLVGLSLLAGRGLFGVVRGGALHGGALPSPPETAGGWWHLIIERSHDIGLGSDSLAPAFAVPLAALSTPVWFSPGVVLTVVMLFAVPLAALAAHRLGRRLTAHRVPRMVWAVGYGLSVVATGAVTQGRIGTVVALIVLPIVANTALQLVESPGWQLGLRLGLWISVGAAFAPIVLPMALVGLVLLVVLEGRWVVRDVVVAAVVPALLLGPWVLQRGLHPTRMWWEAGYAVAQDPSPLQLAFGRAGGPGDAPLWLAVPLVVLAALALVPRRIRVYVQICWVVALIGLAFAVLGSVTSYTTPNGPGEIAAWVGVPVVVWLAALGAAVMLVAPEVGGLPRWGTVTLLVAALVLPLGTAGWWVVRGEQDPLTKSRPTVVPAFLAERPGDTLVITGSVQEGVDVDVVADDGPFLGQEGLVHDPDASREITGAVRSLLASPSAADVERLADGGIDALYAPDVDPDLASRIDAAPLLEPAGSDRPGSRVWTLGEDVEPHRVTGPWWQWLIGPAQVLAWLIALLLTAPVRRRRLPAALDASDEEVLS